MRFLRPVNGCRKTEQEMKIRAELRILSLNQMAEYI
jgi:hypothetical protein